MVLPLATEGHTARRIRPCTVTYLEVLNGKRNSIEQTRVSFAVTEHHSTIG